jgi:hypothetical protein
MSDVQEWHRRHAIQIAAQLPEGIEDALMVLELTRELVETFLAQRDVRRSISGVPAVVPFPASASSR